MAIKSSSVVFLGCLLLVAVRGMDIKNGPNDILKDLPCVKRLNQLFCGSSGNSYPGSKISGFIDDNKALLRRMYGELQEPQTVTHTTVRVVRTFPPLSFAVSQPLIKPQFASPPKRFRRDVLEGTLEEMLEPEIVEEDSEEGIPERFKRSSNATESERVKRQADFPGMCQEIPNRF